jgi:ABC-type branched-subunit amino acid transport system substrate-binding protein
MTDRNSKPVSRRKFLVSIGAAGGAAVLGSAVPFRRAYAAAPPAVNVGQIAPFTGSAAEFGPFYKDAAQLGVNQVNKAAQEVLGGPIIKQLITVDTNTLPTPGIAAARKLVEADGVVAIVGGWSSGVTVAVATSVALPAGVLQIDNGATSPLISVLPADQKADLLFRTTASDALQGVVAAQLATGEIIKDYKFKTASSIYINNPYGQGLSNAFAKSFEKRGGKILAQVPHPEEVQATYKAELATALKGKPELLFLPSYPSHSAVILKESRDIFNFTKWQLTDGNKSDDVLKAVGAQTLNGTLGTAPGEDVDAPAYKGFKQNYADQFHRTRIPPFTAPAYDAAVLIGLALAQAIVKGHITDANAITGSVIRAQLRSVANPGGEEVIGGTQEGVTKALQLIKAGKDINFTGAAGPDDFDKNGDVITPYDIWNIKDGKIASVELWPAKKIPAV